jgi:hypothetical protein
MGKGSSPSLLGEVIREGGETISETDMGLKSSMMEVCTRDCIMMDRSRARGYMSGLMETGTKGTIRMTKLMDMENISKATAASTKDNG